MQITQRPRNADANCANLHLYTFQFALQERTHGRVGFETDRDVVRVMRLLPPERRQEAIEAARALVDQPPGMVENAIAAGANPEAGAIAFERHVRPVLERRGD